MFPCDNILLSVSLKIFLRVRIALSGKILAHLYDSQWFKSSLSLTFT